MLIAATADDFVALTDGPAPRGLVVAPGGIESPEILAMLADLASMIAADFAPAAWMMVERGEIAGLVSITALPGDGVITIGYGVAASRRKHGIATRGIADLVAWAAADGRVTAVTAATSPDNPASQRVLASNGFSQTGAVVDPEDGPLLLWRRELAPARHEG